MTKAWAEYGIWALLIVGAGVALILYQHSVHTGVILSTLLTEAPLPATSVGNSAYTPSPASESQFTGIWTPIGKFMDALFPSTPNPQYPNGLQNQPAPALGPAAWLDLGDVTLGSLGGKIH